MEWAWSKQLSMHALLYVYAMTPAENIYLKENYHCGADQISKSVLFKISKAAEFNQVGQLYSDTSPESE